VVKEQKQLLDAHDMYAEPLFRHCYFRVYDREQAKDLVQEAFMRTWEYLAAGNQIENIRAFLYRTTHNLVIDHVRRKRPKISLDAMQEAGQDVVGETFSDIHIKVESREVVRLLHALEDPYRAVVVMRYVDDMQPKEIAAILGESVNTVSVRIHRAVEKARYLLHSNQNAKEI
jgi:RNA polymerase sigma-70 factor, ECF subfamily